MVQTHLPRWALLCVAASTTLLQAGRTEASHTVVIERGDSIDSLARRFHISIKDIARTNHISPDAVLIDGRKLLIPDPPRAVVKTPTMRRAAKIRGDRITIRTGPDSSYRRLTLLDNGADVIVTRSSGEWRQIELASGKIGWTRADFVSVGRTIAARPAPSKRIAHGPPSKKHARVVRRTAAK